MPRHGNLRTRSLRLQRVGGLRQDRCAKVDQPAWVWRSRRAKARVRTIDLQFSPELPRSAHRIGPHSCGYSHNREATHGIENFCSQETHRRAPELTIHVESSKRCLAAAYLMCFAIDVKPNTSTRVARKKTLELVLYAADT